MQPLIVIGASVRAAAWSARRAGFAPHGIDLFADCDLLEMATGAVRIERYPRGFEQALAAAPDAPWLYTGGLENYPRLIDRLARLRPLWGNTGDALRRVRSLRMLQEVVAEMPRGRIGMPEISPRLRAGLPGEPQEWLVKPRRSSGGQGIRLARDADLVQPPRGSYLQRRVPGEAASAVFLAAGGHAQFLGVTRQLLAADFGLAQKFAYAGSIGPLAISDQETEALVALGRSLASRCGLVGLFGVDFVRDGDRLWLIEVNPRYTASVEVLERASGASFLALHAAAREGKASPSVGQAHMSSAPVIGKAIVYAHNRIAIPASFDDLVQAWNASGAAPQIADLPHIGQTIEAGHPIATVFAEGESEQNVESLLRARATAVRGAGVSPA